MKKIILLFCIGVMFGCQNKKDSNKEEKVANKVGQGNRVYGGIFKLNESEYIKNLFPHNIIDAYSYRIASQIYEGLFKFDQDSLQVIKSLASDYSIDNSKTVYTIHLKRGVFFHDNECFADGKGRELKAEDIKYCFTKLCTQYAGNQGAHVFLNVIKGANQYYEKTKNGGKPTEELEGIKVIDEYTIQITLETPNSLFLAKLCRPETLIFPKEAFEKYGEDMRVNCVGTGAFKLAKEDIDDNVSIILKRNEKYHGVDQFGNTLPFLDAIKISFIKDKQIELLEFKQGNLDMMYRLPADQIFELLQETTEDIDGGQGKYLLQREPEMQTQILSFMNMGEVFKNVNLRKAFSYAIDREKILNYVLNKEGFKAGINGITPPSFPNYDINKISGYSFKPDSARYFLNKAGFPNGKNFPKVVLDLNPEGSRNTNVANEIKKQLKEILNVDIELNQAPHAQITEKCLTGSFNVIRLSWIADFPNPEAFLMMFNGKDVPSKMDSVSYPNISRYKNPKFDELFNKAIQAGSQEESMAYFMKAEQLVMSEAPIIVLWYDEGYRLLQMKVKNFLSNPMQYRDFSQVFFRLDEQPQEQQ
ncbi:MAG: ABC transporter substrate-binding protein [Bacteroidetes bacterium]|nr:MAG: ABC transporter substrate-binding protein [Bacteroidota bacterium]